MKKTGKLKLNRETLHKLSADQLGKAAGGSAFCQLTDEISVCALCWYSIDYCP